MTAADVELVRRGFDALNRGDLDTMLELVAEDVELRPLGANLVEGHAYVGHDGLRAWHRERLTTWRIEYDLDEIVPLGARVLVHGRIHARGAASHVELDARASWVVTLRDGRVARIDSYLDAAEAEAAANATA